MVIFLYKLKDFFLLNYISYKKRIYDLIKFKKNILKVLPYLPKEEIEILTQLSKSEGKFDIYGVAFNLEKQGYIKQIHKVSRSSAIFEINMNVKKRLIKHLAEERKKYIEIFIKDMTEEETKFLYLFFSDDVNEGTCESGNYMEHTVFQAGKNMAHKQVIFLSPSNISKKTDFEIFKIEPEVAKILEKRLFHKKKARDNLKLDLKFIYASNASGGGCTQSHMINRAVY